MTKLGQNFLIDKKVAEKEIHYADINSNDVVLEIGPGKGILTELLAKKAKKIVAVEIDTRLYNELKENLPDNVVLINSDVLKLDFNDIAVF